MLDGESQSVSILHCPIFLLVNYELEPLFSWYYFLLLFNVGLVHQELYNIP